MSVISKRRSNNMVSVGDKKSGTPADAFCRPGQYDVKDGKKYSTVPGATRWSKGK